MSPAKKESNNSLALILLGFLVVFSLVVLSLLAATYSRNIKAMPLNPNDFLWVFYGKGHFDLAPAPEDSMMYVNRSDIVHWVKIPGINKIVKMLPGKAIICEPDGTVWVFEAEGEISFFRGYAKRYQPSPPPGPVRTAVGRSISCLMPRPSAGSPIPGGDIVLIGQMTSQNKFPKEPPPPTEEVLIE